MADTTFVAGTLSDPAWFNDVNDTTYGGVAFLCATRTLLKANDTVKNPIVHLTEAGREGFFKWTLGNFATRITADTQEGIYLLSDSFASTVGAWVRVTSDDTLWKTDWFGVPNANGDGTGTECSTEYSAMVALANIVKPAGIQFGQGLYSFDSKPTAPTFICIIAGVDGGTQPSILIKRYVDTAAGLLSFTTHAPRIKNIGVQAIGAGISAGNLAISGIAAADPIIGDPLLENVRTSMGTDFSAEVLFDGTVNSVSAAKGYRNGTVKGLQCFGNLVLKSCQHWRLSDLFVEDDYIITGTSGAPADDIISTGIVGRHWNLSNALAANGYITRCVHNGPVSGSVLNTTTNTSTTYLIGSFGIIAERAWDTTTCRVYSQATIRDYGTTANGIYIIWGNGDIEQWGSVTTVAGDATVTFPLPFPATVTSATANVSTAPAAGVIQLAQAHTFTVNTMLIRSMSLTAAGPLAALSAVIVKWYAKGS